MNVRGAWLHVLTDALGSVGALVAGGLIWVFGWDWADPAASVVIGLLVLYSSWGLLRESVAVLMEWAPGNVDVDEVCELLADVDGVERVHDLHVWSVTSGRVALSAHLAVDGRRPGAAVLDQARVGLRERFGIRHSTLQIEEREVREGDGCGCPE